MSESSRAAVAHRQPAVQALSGKTGLLQRACACGQHTMAGGECEECRKQRTVLQRRATNQSESTTAPPIVHEVLRSPGQPLDADTRAFMEPRFGHDFSRVRVHSGPKAAESARAVKAEAYTVGSNLVFAAGRFNPGTQGGRQLIAHELTHVVQAAGHAGQPAVFESGNQGTPKDIPVIRRKPENAGHEAGEALAWEFEVIEYGTYLEKNGDIEGMPTSGMKALVYARRRLKGERLALPKNGDALLVIEILNIAPDAEQRQVALSLLEQMNSEILFGMISREPTDQPGKIGIWELAGKFQGDELMRVLDFLSRRFKGDFTGLLKDKGKLEPTEDVELEKRTLDWLASNRKTAEQYFGDVWMKSRVVLLGETHHKGVQQRRFAADMIRRYGGPEVTLALETRHQAAVEAYLKSRDQKVLPEWFVPGEYTRLLDAARATGTWVNAVDTPLPSFDPGRDLNMASAIEVEEELGNKVLFYGGAQHIREVRGHHGNPLGRLLSGTYGENSYAISMEFTDTLTNQFFSMLRQRFPKLPSIGFDVDKSPLRWRKDPDVAKRTDLGENIDGYIYFLK